MGTNRCLFDSLWVQLKKFASLISWPTWLENRQSWIIKIRAEFIIQVSLVPSERVQHKEQNHLLCGDKISDFRNWLIEAWMSAEEIYKLKFATIYIVKYVFKSLSRDSLRYKVFLAWKKDSVTVSNIRWQHLKYSQPTFLVNTHDIERDR